MNYENRFRLHYDAHNQRVAVFEEWHAGEPGRHFYQYIVLHRQNVQYTIDISASPRKCLKSPVTRPWHEWGVPANATFAGEFTLGVLGDGLTAQQWVIRHSQGGVWAGTYTLNGCVPVSVVNATSIRDAITTSFYDVVVGLPDPNIFIPPTYCPA